MSDFYSRGSFNRGGHSYLMGLLLGVPFVYPSIPYYWFAFFVFGSVLLYSNKNLSNKTVLFIFFAMLISMVSSVFGVATGNYDIDPIRIVFTTAFFAFFVFGELVPDKTKIIRGYVDSLNIMSAAVILAVLFVWPFGSGLLFFSVPELRLWGAPFFPDWPNYLAFMLSLAFLFNTFVFKNRSMALINLVAALLTTSRTPLIAVAIVILIVLLTKGSNRFVFKLIFVSFLIAVILFITAGLSETFISRLLITSDRVTVYGHALSMIQASPIIGHGAVLFDSSVGLERFSSFHNSYLDITVRHGVLGLLIFLILIWPRSAVTKGQYSAYWAIVVFFLVGALFQNFMKHPHLIMMYTVIISSRGVFR